MRLKDKARYVWQCMDGWERFIAVTYCATMALGYGTMLYALITWMVAS